MISFLSGKVIKKNDDSIVLDVAGVGYLVHLPEAELKEIALESEVRLFTYLAVKENALDLYGSRMSRTIDWFRLLLHVKGVGPKSALAFLSKAAPKDLATAIQHDDPKLLIALGIGKKSAERIVLELQNKAKDVIGDLGDASHSAASAKSDTLQALEALGYSRAQAREALDGVTGDEVGDLVKNALKVLGK